MTSSRGAAVAALLCAGVAAGEAPRASPAWVGSHFKVHAGDDPAWSAPGLDDRHWQAVDSTLPPGTRVTGWSGIGWFRRELELGPERAVPLYGRFTGAAEVYLDGVLQFAVGDPSAVVEGGSTPVEWTGDVARWLAPSAPGRHLLAVRFASRHVEALQRVALPGGFELVFGGTRVVAPRFGGALNATLIGAALALALLHLLLFAFHRDRRENLYYALTALGVACIIAFNAGLRFSTTATGALALIAGFYAAVTLSAVSLLRFYHAVFSPKLPPSYWLIFGLGCAVSAASWALPRGAVYGFAAVAALAQFRVLVGAVARRASGAWIIGIGGGLWLLGASLQMLGDTNLGPRIQGAYLYGFLALLVSMSVYLARDIARDKDDLARKLTEIGELSTRERAAMERYRTVFQTTGTATIVFGDDAIISLANDEWVQLTGYLREEIEGQMAWMAFFSEASLEKMRVYHRLRSEDPAAAPRAYEAQLRDRRGNLRDGVVTISLVPGTQERVGSFLDLTDLKRAQRQMARADKMAALGQIVAGVAHEINNPNNFIHFNLPVLRRYVEAMRPLLELQLEQDPDLTLLNMRYQEFIDDLFKLIENMEHGSSRITAIVSDLKSYLRSGEDVAMTAGSLAPVVDRVMALVGKQVRKMVKRFDVSVAEGLPPVRMNAGKIEQVLINLVINAGQAADKADSWVQLTVRAADPADAVELKVEDNGTGIPAESLEQIFEPFFTTKGRETGTGLGLSISQQILEEHGGRIEVSSEPGKGSCFTVRLPALRPA